MEKNHTNKTPRDEEYVTAYLKHKSQIKAAKECGVGRETIARAVRRAGIKLQGQHNAGNYGGGSTPKISDAKLIEEVKALTRTEIANKYGMNVATVDRRMRRLGLHAVKQKRASQENEFHWTPGAASMVAQRQGGKFRLVGIKGGRLKLECCTCGAVIERARSTVKQKTVICDNCKKIEQEEKELERGRRNLVYALQAIAEKKKPKICARCGKVFYSEHPDKKYCSKKCKQKKAGNYRERARKYGVKYEPGITLGKIFARDGGVCQICGKRCDWNDNSWHDSFGAMYPTIDHIRALANGGSHTWDNVQLAHAICNSAKRDIY